MTEQRPLTILEQSVAIEEILNKYNSYCVMKWVGNGEFGIVFKIGYQPVINISFTKGTYKFKTLQDTYQLTFNTYDELTSYLVGDDFKKLMKELQERYDR